jgi:tRNA G26 N,N-dimethylase Trm1
MTQEPWNMPMNKTAILFCRSCTAQQSFAPIDDTKCEKCGHGHTEAQPWLLGEFSEEDAAIMQTGNNEVAKL